MEENETAREVFNFIYSAYVVIGWKSNHSTFPDFRLSKILLRQLQLSHSGGAAEREGEISHIRRWKMNNIISPGLLQSIGFAAARKPINFSCLFR